MIRHIVNLLRKAAGNLDFTSGLTACSCLSDTWVSDNLQWLESMHTFALVRAPLPRSSFPSSSSLGDCSASESGSGDVRRLLAVMAPLFSSSVLPSSPPSLSSSSESRLAFLFRAVFVRLSQIAHQILRSRKTCTFCNLLGSTIWFCWSLSLCYGFAFRLWFVL